MTFCYVFPHEILKRTYLLRPPKILKKKMTEKQKAKANSVRPFCKFVNVRHLMPTRYSLDNYQDLNPMSVVLNESRRLTKREKSIEWDSQDPSQKKESLKAVKIAFEERYNE